MVNKTILNILVIAFFIAEILKYPIGNISEHLTNVVISGALAILFLIIINVPGKKYSAFIFGMIYSVFIQYFCLEYLGISNMLTSLVYWCLFGIVTIVVIWIDKKYDKELF